MTTSAPEAFGVVVGFDGSPHSYDALDWGASAAQNRGSALTVVTAYSFPYVVSGYVDSSSQVSGQDLAQQTADQLLGQAKQHLGDRDGEHVHYMSITGDATGGLVQVSDRADLIVVGRRGLGRFWGRLLGSVSSALPAHAQCPTVIVYPKDEDRQPGDTSVAHGTDTRPITVGVDTSDQARTAALAAADEAIRLDTELQIVLAMPPFSGPPTWFPELVAEVERQEDPDAANRILAEEVNWLQEQRPEAKISGSVKRGIPAEVMIALSGDSQLTVLGTRGRGGFASLMLGSVSRTTLSQARGTVMVVPSDDDK